MSFQASSFHLLKPDDHYRVGNASLNHASGEIQARASGTAVVVDVVDGDPGHAELVENTLTAGAVAIAEACDALVDVIVVYVGV